MENTRLNPLKIFLLTLIFILLSHHIAIFIHEYAHGFTAWLLGYKNSPFDINYGGSSLSNLLLLSNVDQKVNNNLLYAAGHPGHVALIAFAGPGLIMLLFFLVSLLIQSKRIINHPYLQYFLLFFNLWCLGGTYAYVPVRTFSSATGSLVDVLDIEQAVNISPWLIYFFVGYLVIFMMWIFFSKNLITIYNNVVSSLIGRASLMITCVLIVFGYCGMVGFYGHGEIAHFISSTSVLAIPIIIIMLWPTKKWVKEKLFTSVSSVK